MLLLLHGLLELRMVLVLVYCFVRPKLGFVLLVREESFGDELLVDVSNAERADDEENDHSYCEGEGPFERGRVGELTQNVDTLFGILSWRSILILECPRLKQPLIHICRIRHNGSGCRKCLIPIFILKSQNRRLK